MTATAYVLKIQLESVIRNAQRLLQELETPTTPHQDPDTRRLLDTAAQWPTQPIPAGQLATTAGISPRRAHHILRAAGYTSHRTTAGRFWHQPAS